MCPPRSPPAVSSGRRLDADVEKRQDLASGDHERSKGSFAAVFKAAAADPERPLPPHRSTPAPSPGTRRPRGGIRHCEGAAVESERGRQAKRENCCSVALLSGLLAHRWVAFLRRSPPCAADRGKQKPLPDQLTPTDSWAGLRPGWHRLEPWAALRALMVDVLRLGGRNKCSGDATSRDARVAPLRLQHAMLTESGDCWLSMGCWCPVAARSRGLGHGALR